MKAGPEGGSRRMWSTACLLAVALGCSGVDGAARRDATAADGGPTTEAGTHDARSPSSDGSVDGSSEPGDATAGDAGDASSLLTCSVLAAFELDEIDPPAARSEGYVVPSEAELDAAEAMVRALAEGRIADAVEHASEIDFEICRGEDDEAGLVLARPLPPTRGWARLAVRTAPARGLIFEAPHPLHDRDTVAESIVLFRSLEARALVASGTHRCANAGTGCSGSSSVCGTDPAVYRESDAAHATDAVFHRAHVALAETFASDVVVSVHGMGGDGISVSDGTTDAVEGHAPAARLAMALVDAGFTDVTLCNPGTDVPVAERLCGTSNVQGRHLNGSPDACTEAADAASGRFVHLEQALDVRHRPDEVAAAFAAAFSE